MVEITGHYATAHGSKYLQQLCKHFGHKIEVSYDTHQGRCQFIFGAAFLTADDAGLTVRFELAKPDHIQAAQGVIDSHLVTFAHREGFKTMVWQP